MPCVFCQRDGPLTAEHVFPQWPRSHLEDASGSRGVHTRWIVREGESEPDEQTRPGKPATLTVRSVCAECNSGWMSRLEGDAKPYLESMIRGSRREYHSTGRTLIARWFVKTALVRGSRFPPALRREFYEQARTTGEPSDTTRVWIGATPRKQMHYTDFRQIWVHEPQERPPGDPNGYSCVIAVGHLVGFVVSWLDREPSLAGVLPRFERALVQAWPLSEATSTWPPHTRLDLNGLDDLADTVVDHPDRPDWRAHV